MIEGFYGWNEHCPTHAKAVLAVNPEKKHRPISIFEVCNSWRDYKCYACAHLLWDRNNQPDAPEAPKPAPRTGSSLVVLGSQKKETA